MTWILILLCLAIAGRELYLAFDRRRPSGAPELADIRTQLGALKSTRDELENFRAAQREQSAALEAADARIASLVTQINDRLLPEVNQRLARQREAGDALAAEVARLRGHLAGRLDQAAAASLGADPADIVTGSLAGGDPAAFERFAERYGMHVEFTDPPPSASPGTPPTAGGPTAPGSGTAAGGGTARYFLSGRSPRGLERDFLDLLHALRGECDGENIGPALDLLAVLRADDRAGAQLGPLLLARTSGVLLCGVLPLVELRKAGPVPLAADPEDAVNRLLPLPESRRFDASEGPLPR